MSQLPTTHFYYLIGGVILLIILLIYYSIMFELNILSSIPDIYKIIACIILMSGLSYGIYRYIQYKHNKDIDIYNTNILSMINTKLIEPINEDKERSNWLIFNNIYTNASDEHKLILKNYYNHFLIHNPPVNPRIAHLRNQWLNKI